MYIFGAKVSFPNPMPDSPSPPLNWKFTVKDKQTENTQAIPLQKLIIILPLNFPQCQSFKQTTTLNRSFWLGIPFSRFHKTYSKSNLL